VKKKIVKTLKKTVLLRRRIPDSGTDYSALRDAIVRKIRSARFLAAKAVNREILVLYYSIGKLLSEKASKASWGARTLQTLSGDIQRHIPGIRGFSERNLKNMRRFFEHFQGTEFGQLLTAQIGGIGFGQLPTAQSP
jgi:hypothetical protein